MADKVFKRKEPFLVAAGIASVLIVLCWWFFFHTMIQRIALRQSAVSAQVAKLEAVEAQLMPIEARQAELKAKAETLADMTFLRTQWLDVLNGIHDCMLDGMWLVAFAPATKAGTENGRQTTDDRQRGGRSRRAAATLASGGDSPKWTHIQIKGLIFSDKATDRSIAQFRDRLRQSPLFTESTEILLAPLPNLDDYARQFTMEIGLKQPL
ncbi:MAG: hypothetical protein WC567_07465, partial [Kiritimatiellia bacterium]